jgi:ribA/ribD-fused uncharacterized protein
MQQYTFFWNGIYSNFHTAPFTYKGHKFNNSEQAFMWEKANFFGDTQMAYQILQTPVAHEAKGLGRKVKNYNDWKWSQVRFDYMYDVCLAKFQQNKKLKQQLLKDYNFVEASPYDKIWGIGMAEHQEGIEDPNNWKGQNLLGKVLDKVRETILNN